jgi:hypothetical protein
MIANGPVSTFIPIIVSGFGYSPLNSLLLSMPGGAIIGTVELCACYAALRFHNSRTWIIIICQLATVLACLLLWQLPRNEKGGLLFAVYILASFGGSYAVVMGLAVANAAGYTKRSMSSAGLFLGMCILLPQPSPICKIVTNRKLSLAKDSALGISLGLSFSKSEKHHIIQLGLLSRGSHL